MSLLLKFEKCYRCCLCLLGKNGGWPLPIASAVDHWTVSVLNSIQLVVPASTAGDSKVLLSLEPTFPALSNLTIPGTPWIRLRAQEMIVELLTSYTCGITRLSHPLSQL
ncbi:hypothetical protein BT67DRAFT_440656 [Trichocladium antarcticum]|uniref:Uncharacterized protein n=1 Tax=Trichocladium antarcticum TaxID=1450529 RepID=A0AAN6ZFP3_9PEZI|nr:hypothetical protein BT67DRAFT_440656 [Trichocladium antarcticum]